jgi:hypothetical protein
MSVDKFNEDIVAVLEQYLGNCTCKHSDELKINIMEATADISSVLLSFLQPFLLEEKRIQEANKVKWGGFMEWLKHANRKAEGEEEEELALCPSCEKETPLEGIIRGSPCVSCGFETN